MEDGDPKDEFATVVTNCARCGKKHVVEWFRFRSPCGEYTHWGMCEESDEPILMKIEHVTT